MADFNDFLNTQSDPMSSSNVNVNKSNIQQRGDELDRPNKPELSTPKQEETAPTDTTKVETNVPSVPQPQSNGKEDKYIYAFGQRVKELKLEDINNIEPDYDSVETQFQTEGDEAYARAQKGYEALVKQIQEDAKYYQTGDGEQYTSKIGTDYSTTMLNNVKDGKFNWDKYLMKDDYSRPIYSYGKESAIRSALKGTASFFTNLGTSLRRVTKLPTDVVEGIARTNELKNPIYGDILKEAYSVNDDSSYVDNLKKMVGDQMAETTKIYKDINKSLDIQLGIEQNKETNELAYQIGGALGNIALNYLSLGAGAFAKTIQGANAIRACASNLTVAAYSAAAFQSYALDAMAAGKDPLKAHAVGAVNAGVQGIIEKWAFNIQAKHLGAGSYKSASDLLKNYKNIDKDTFIKGLYRNSLAASTISEGLEEGAQQLVEDGLKILQGINDKDSVDIIEDIACSIAMGAVLSLPMAHIAARSQAGLRNRIANQFSNLNEKDANALATVFLVYGDNLSKDKEFQKEYVKVLKDNILNLKPTDVGQDTNPLSTNGIVQELDETAPAPTQGTTVLDKMIKNKENLKESLFELMVNPERKEELDNTMMDVSKQIKKYATTHMGQTEDEAGLTSALMQEHIFAMAVSTDMSAKQIFNAIMPKVHNRSTISALTNYQSNTQTTKDTLLKYQYNYKEGIDKFNNNVSLLKDIIDNDKSLEKITQLKREGKTLELSEFEKTSQELKATVQRETAIQQQIRRIKGQPIDYSIARDIAIYKLLGVSERSLINFVDSKYIFNSEGKYRDNRTKHLLASIDTTNDDFLGYESANTNKLVTAINEKGVDAAVDMEVDNMAQYKEGAIYANRARDIIDTIKRNKNYKITKQDSEVLNRALSLADTTMSEGLFGFYNATSTVNPMIVLDRLATGDVTAHEFCHHIIEQVITINNVLAKHTGYHMVYFNNLINGINNILKVQGYKNGILNPNGTLNTEAHEMFANILEDYIMGRMVFDSIEYTDADRDALSSLLDSYNNWILKSSTVTFNKTNNAGIYRPNKPMADELARTALLRKSAYSNLSLSAYLTKELDSIINAENMPIKEALSKLKAVYNIAMESKMLSKPTETSILLNTVYDRVMKANPINLFASADGDLYIVLTNLYTDINKTTLDNIITQEGPDVDVKSSAALSDKKKKNVIELPESIRQNISKLVTLKINDRIKAAEDKKASEILQALREKLFDKENKTVSKLKEDIFKDIYKNNKDIVKKIDKIAYAYTKEAMLENDIELDTEEWNAQLAAANLEEEKEAINEKYSKIIEEDKEFLKEQQDENKALDKEVEAVSKEISTYLSTIKGITEDDLEIVSKEFAKNIVQDYASKNQQNFTTEIDEAEEEKLRQTLTPQAESEAEYNVEQQLEERVVNTYGLTSEENAILDAMLAAKDLGEEEVKPAVSEEQQDGDPNYDISNITKQVEKQRKKNKGNTDKDVKPESLDELDFKYKRATQAERYAIVQAAIESQQTTHGKAIDIMTLTEREVMSQDIVNDDNTKSLADVQKSIKALVTRKALEYNDIVENFCGCNPIKLLARGWENFKDYFSITSNRLNDIASKFKSDKNILSGLRYAEYQSLRKFNSYVRTANEFLSKAEQKIDRKNNLQEYQEFVSALWTDDAKYRQRALEIAEKYGFTNELNNLVLVLEECKNLRIKLGMFRKGKEYYFPRQVKNVRELLKEIISDPSEPLAKILISNKFTLNKIEVMDENQLLGLYNSLVKRDLAHNKQRVIQVMKPKYLKYYYDMSNALENYFLEQKDLMFKASFFENVKVTEKQLAQMHEAYQKCPYNTAEGWYSILKQMGYLDKTNDYDNKNNKIIASYVDAIFFREGSTKLLKAYRDFTSITLISNPISALENFKDIGNIVAQYGMGTAFKSFLSANNDMRKQILEDKSKIEEYNLIQQLCMDTVKGEFKDMHYQGLSKWSEGCRQVSGFAYLDSLNKVTYMRATITKYRNKLKSKNAEVQKKTIDEIYKIANNNEEIANEIIATLQMDIKDMRSSDAIKFFLWSKMCENYPLSKLEMPKAYNLHNWTRFFYNFKMQPLKIANRVVYQYKEKFENAKTWKEKSVVLKDLVKILMYYAACGIPVDYLKDILRGVPTDSLPEYAAYSVASNFLLNEYTIDNIKNDGLLKGVWSGLMPAEPVSRAFSRPFSVVPVAGVPFDSLLNNW